MMRKVGLRQIGFADISGGGQVMVAGDLCFVGHMDAPDGTTILDVSDPGKPRIVGRTAVPPKSHSHKVRAADGIMLVNFEANPAKDMTPGFTGGLRIFDISRPDAPREIAFHPTSGRGVHRFDFDGRHAYLSTEMPGYEGNIISIVDVADPVRPHEVSRWWMPGQWTAGGEVGPSKEKKQFVHHPLRFGDYLYVGCCHAGMALVDVSDLSHPKTVSRHPLHGLFTHTVLPASTAQPVDRAKPAEFAIAVDEGWWDLDGWLSVLDLSRPQEPLLVAEYDVPPGPGRFIWAAHQPHEEVLDGLLYVAWFRHGLRVVDVTDPRQPREAGSFVPEPRSEAGVMSNDVFVDRAAGRVYLLDRMRGLDILELTS